MLFITTDFLMTKESEQRSNLKWIVDLISRPLNKATGIKSKVLFSGFQSDSIFNRSIFLKLSGIELKPLEQQFHFEADDILQTSLNYLVECIGENSLIIGYELSDSTRSILNRCGIKYIDIWLHPVRFMDDVLFAIRSNDDCINLELNHFEYNAELCWMHADRLKVQNYRGFRRSKFDAKENSALFVGQTLNDKAIAHRGVMLNLLDYKNEFECLTKSHERIYYSRHPFVKSGDENVISFLKSFRNVEIVSVPTYELLANQNVATTVTISSSVATEAYFFGKDISYYFKPPVGVFKLTNPSYTSTQHEIFTEHFWAKILKPIYLTSNAEPVRFESVKDKVRDTLSFYWGYRDIDKVESLKQTVSKMLNR